MQFRTLKQRRSETNRLPNAFEPYDTRQSLNKFPSSKMSLSLLFCLWCLLVFAHHRWQHIAAVAAKHNWLISSVLLTSISSNLSIGQMFGVRACGWPLLFVCSAFKMLCTSKMNSTSRFERNAKQKTKNEHTNCSRIRCVSRLGEGREGGRQTV